MTYILQVIGSLFVDKAYALANLPITCTGLVGCGSQPGNILINGVPHIALILLQIAAGGCVLAIVWAGFQMVLSLGDGGKISQAKNAILFALLGLGISVLAQFFISSVVSEYVPTSDPTTIHLDIIKGIIRYLRNILNAALAVVIVIGAVRMVLAQGKQDEFTKGRTAIMWAAIGAIIVNFAAIIASVASGILGV